MNRRFLLLALAGLYLAVFLATVGFLFVVTRITHGAIDLAIVGGLIVASAEVIIGIAVTGEVFVQVSDFLWTNKTSITIF